VIDFLHQRAERQMDAREKIARALTEYNVGAVDTLIGDIVPPDELMKTLTDRKIAEQERVTYETQCGAEKVRQELQQARALADTQAKVVDSERSVAIAEFAAKASIKAAEGAARSKTLLAEADANVIKTVGAAEAEKTKAVGLAEAEVTKAKVAATDPDKFVSVEIARALSNSGQKLVPDILVGAGANGGSGSTIIEMLAAQMFKGRLEAARPVAPGNS
jgi:regulator of protease activity HflC (stomatin/prohibitin superfamily)